MPLNNILIDGVVFRFEPKRIGFQVVLDGNIIWDFPFEFYHEVHDTRNNIATIMQDTWYNYHLVNLYRFLKTYLDTPIAALDDIDADYCGLRDILLAADRRRNRARSAPLLFTTDSKAAREIISYRFRDRHEKA